MRARLIAPVLAGVLLPLSAALADSRMEKTFRLEPGGRFLISTEIGKVTVTGTGSPGVKLVVSSRRRELDDLLSFSFREDAGSVGVTARKKRRHLFPWNDGGGDVHFDVQVPAETAIDVDTSGGGIRIYLVANCGALRPESERAEKARRPAGERASAPALPE